jgi:hypothetical protein
MVTIQMVQEAGDRPLLERLNPFDIIRMGTNRGRVKSDDYPSL